MISGYSNIEEIGRGGMGCVYRATENKSGKLVAIKMMSNKVTCYPEYRALFSSEAKTLSELNHPSIVKMSGFSFSDEKGNLYLPMEFVEGETILQHVKRNGAYAEARGIELMSKILDAMQYVYSHNKIHRDIKPSNIMLRPDGTICIIDFGIAKDTQISTGMTVGNVIGTSGYMSPEQATGLNIDHRTDIYSLGCLLFFILSGQDAISKASNDFETKLRVLDSVIPDIRQINPSISKETASAIKKATDKNMLKRFQTPEEFKQALESGNATTDGLLKVVITIGRGVDNDVVIATENYISQHHGQIVVIESVPNAMPSIIFEDFSSNGTGVNGKYIHHSKEQITLCDIDSMPEILLAGRAENKVNWQDVDFVYQQKTGHTLFKKVIAKEEETRIDIQKPHKKLWIWLFVGLVVLIIIIIILSNC